MISIYCRYNTLLRLDLDLHFMQTKVSFSIMFGYSCWYTSLVADGKHRLALVVVRPPGWCSECKEVLVYFQVI